MKKVWAYIRRVTSFWVMGAICLFGAPWLAWDLQMDEDFWDVVKRRGPWR